MGGFLCGRRGGHGAVCYISKTYSSYSCELVSSDARHLFPTPPPHPHSPRASDDHQPVLRICEFRSLFSGVTSKRDPMPLIFVFLFLTYFT